ncbi:hypothetical protein AGMMS4957_09610 [Bacteroidia bacterium]|nr:hypothetical protein AGMMS4957_09610 [Bacteroidia bacterium]
MPLNFLKLFENSLFGDWRATKELFVMAEIKFSVDWFIDTVKDGNLSFATIKGRIAEASLLLNGKDTILLTSINKTVTNESELVEAIEEHLKTR